MPLKHFKIAVYPLISFIVIIGSHILRHAVVMGTVVSGVAQKVAPRLVILMYKFKQ